MRVFIVVAQNVSSLPYVAQASSVRCIHKVVKPPEPFSSIKATPCPHETPVPQPLPHHPRAQPPSCLCDRDASPCLVSRSAPLRGSPKAAGLPSWRCCVGASRREAFGTRTGVHTSDRASGTWGALRGPVVLLRAQLCCLLVGFSQTSHLLGCSVLSSVKWVY